MPDSKYGSPPWRTEVAGANNGTVHVLDSNDDILAVFYSAGEAGRSTACVNACAGLADPEKDVAGLREAEGKSCEEIAVLFGENSQLRADVAELVAALREIRGVLGAEPRGQLAVIESITRQALARHAPVREAKV